MVIKRTLGEKIFDVFNVFFLTLLMIVCIYPFLYVAFASISEPGRIIAHRGFLLWPLGFKLDAYAAVFRNEMVLIGYANTMFYVIVGTSFNLIMTVLGAYPLSRKNLYWGKPISLLILFTMFFYGGLIPTFLLVKGLGMYNSRLALIIPTAISTYYLLIMRTYFMSIPDSVQESAKIDGANDFTILFKIVIPLSAPIMAVMTLFYGILHWNGWFYAMVFLRDRTKYPLQLVLREILITSKAQDMLQDVSSLDMMGVAETIKYATIMVAIIPVLIIYPFLQKYFVKGVMVGAIKG